MGGWGGRQWDTCAGWGGTCTCPANSLSMRIGYGSQWISTVTAPTGPVECCYNSPSCPFPGGDNPNPTVGTGSLICQCQASSPVANLWRSC